jgi:predicted TPR repeat methyltransferase
MTVEQQLESGMSHHRAGRLAQARASYLEVLALDPSRPEPLDLLGVVAIQSGQFDQAIDWIRRAIAVNPRVAGYHSHLGNALQGKGQREEAIAAWRVAIGLDGGFAEAYANLGNALRERGQLKEAVDACRQAVRLDPNSVVALNNLGAALQGPEQLDEAIAVYRQALRINPNLPKTHNNLANALLGKRQLDEAIAEFQLALQLKPESADIHQNLGTALYEKGRLDEAIAAYRHAIRLKPDCADSYNNLGLALQKAGRKEEAYAAYREAIRLRPDMPEWEFRLAALSGDGSVTTAPTQYLRKLFEEYARKFDKHLVEKLKYQAPQQLLRAVRAATPRRDLDVLDLGCGTGLCGQEFRPYARRLVGVDLSPAMIRAAGTRGIYDQLITGEILPVLREAPESYDLITAGDVLIYVGDLTDFMPAVARALRSGGLFACSTEDYDGQGFFLHSQERFAHSIGYVRQMAWESGLTEISADKAAIRCNAGAEVPGRIVVLGKRT